MKCKECGDATCRACGKCPACDDCCAFGDLILEGGNHADDPTERALMERGKQVPAVCDHDDDCDL